MFHELPEKTSPDIDVDNLIQQIKAQKISFKHINNLMYQDKLSKQDFLRIIAEAQDEFEKGFTQEPGLLETITRSLEYQAANIKPANRRPRGCPGVLEAAMALANSICDEEEKKNILRNLVDVLLEICNKKHKSQNT